MDIYLYRQYFPNGTNGSLYLGDQFICHSIELPWLNNQKNKSCIPEGVYPIVQRRTTKRGLHLLVNAVPQRSLILIHPANNALAELKGCIAPVTTTTGQGIGQGSRKACDKLLALVLQANEPVELVIKKEQVIIH